MPDYTVMKAAVLSLSRLVADLEAKEGILVNAVCPGPSLTPAWLEEGGLADQTAARSGAQPRARRWPRPAAGPARRPHGRARGDRRRRRLPLLGPCVATSLGAAWGVDGGYRSRDHLTQRRRALRLATLTR